MQSASAPLNISTLHHEQIVPTSVFHEDKTASSSYEYYLHTDSVHMMKEISTSFQNYRSTNIHGAGGAASSNHLSPTTIILSLQTSTEPLHQQTEITASATPHLFKLTSTVGNTSPAVSLLVNEMTSAYSPPVRSSISTFKRKLLFIVFSLERLKTFLFNSGKFITKRSAIIAAITHFPRYIFSIFNIVY